MTPLTTLWWINWQLWEQHPHHSTGKESIKKSFPCAQIWMSKGESKGVEKFTVCLRYREVSENVHAGTASKKNELSNLQSPSSSASTRFIDSASTSIVRFCWPIFTPQQMQTMQSQRFNLFSDCAGGSRGCNTEKHFRHSSGERSICGRNRTRQ